MYNIALIDDDQRILQIVQYKVKSIFNSVGIDPTITCFNNPQKLHMDTDVYKRQIKDHAVFNVNSFENTVTLS